MCYTSDVSPYTPYITAFGGLVAGWFGSYFIGVKLAQRNHDRALEITRINHEHSNALAYRNEFNKAAAEFRSAFVADKHAFQQAIDTPSSDDQGFFLMRKLHKGDVAIALEKAKIMFEPYLTATELKGFSAAWKNYYVEWPRHFHDDYDNKEKTFEMLRHLEALLEHAAPK